jgi:hypothetical protein
MNRGGPSVSLPMPHRRGIPPQKTRKSRNPSTDGRELRHLLRALVILSPSSDGKNPRITARNCRDPSSVP